MDGWGRVGAVNNRGPDQALARLRKMSDNRNDAAVAAYRLSVQARPVPVGAAPKGSANPAPRTAKPTRLLPAAW